ncbi:MAG: 3-keto-disaccharide hydrolase [Verrucomicrobiota bacterium]
MIRYHLFAILALALFTATGASKGPQSLFNGKNLDGWVKLHDGEWTVENGELVARKGVAWTTNPEVSGSWLRTEKEYTDFIFELEYSVNEKGNSGVFIRSAIEKNPAFTGHEIQILDDHGREPKKFTTGALYDVVAPSKNMSKPANQWNTLKIEAKGPRVQVWHNGEKIVDHTPARSLKGYLGLQNHDDKAVTRFRNIRVTDLSE